MFPRRDFVLATAAATAVSTASSIVHAQKDEKRVVRIGVMGLTRGQSLALDLAKLDGVEVAIVCDVDENHLRSSAKQLQEQSGGTAPRTTKDFRDILADKQIDALVCAAPNHWHAPATIMGCKAGKHVYVEKPCSHNPREGEWMVEAANKFGRCVQMGSQRRSSAGTQAAMAKLHGGAIGKVHLSRCYYNSLRGPIGKGAEAQPPKGLDYDLWQGPAPRKPFRDNILHYNWHWFWHWGGGELANNGVHGLDLCRWGLNVDYPVRSVSSGGRYWYDDDQETPDVHSVCFEFEGDRQITWDALSCNKHAPGYFCAFYGDEGTLELDGDGRYRIFDRNDKEIEKGTEEPDVGQRKHLQNFIDAVRAGDPKLLNQPILEAHKSTLLCHLGNIAQRTGRTVRTDPSNGHIRDDAEQLALWKRDYDPAWEADVSM